ncbi:MAG: Ion transport protein [Firmicutes bacterium]|nr:Ion transport protein [Bacillota bacterium]
MGTDLSEIEGNIGKSLYSKYYQLKINTHQLFERNTINTIGFKSFHIFMVILILLNVLAVMLETVDQIAEQYADILLYFEYFSVALFSVEYLLRIWCCNVNKKYTGHIIGRLKFIFTPLALIDLLSVIPFYLPIFITFDLRFIRLIRLSRIFRLFKLGRYSSAYTLIKHVIIAKKEYLTITMIFGMTLLIISSCMMYFVEHEAQPEIFSSIPATMWWGIVTLTTVGYGDAYPITPLGKFLSAILALLGIGLFALPAGILASGFSEEIHKQHCETLCPHCGKDINS